MRITTFLIITFLGVNLSSCSSSQTKAVKKDFSIEYSASTRGSQTKITIKNDSLIVRENGVHKKTEDVFYRQLFDEDWNSIIEEIQKIDLDKIGEFKAPTNRRIVDAARSSQIHVFGKEKTYSSDFFDEGMPPKELKVLVDKVVKLYTNSKKE